ncbi:MAG: efflux RND transporter periplasmic adaptor subunit [Hyphomicrobium sp.]
MARRAWVLMVALATFGAAAATAYWVKPALLEDAKQIVGLAPKATGAAAAKPATGSDGQGHGAGERRRGQTGGANTGGAAGGIRQVPVEVSPVRQTDTASEIRAVGSLLSDEAVVLAPELSGRISEILFKEGQPVKAGDVLAKLDDALAKAEVADAQARLTFASANNDRARALSRTGNVTGRARDESVANFETAQAALELAQTRLSKLVLRAPFDGVAGVRNVSAGAFVNAGTAIVNIEKIDTLKVEFKVPEIHLKDVKVGNAIEVNVDAVPGQTFAGEIYAINPLLDVNGRALQVRAKLVNKDMVLRPGLFARVAIKGETRRGVIVVPEAAIVPRGGDTYVFRVADGKAQETRVKIGERANAEVEIVEGLDAVAVVVTAGQQRLRNGDAVDVLTTGSTAPAAGQPDAAKSDLSQSQPTGGKS